MKKRLLVIICMLACLFMTTVSAKAADNTGFDEDVLWEEAQALIDEWFSLDFAGLLEEYADLLAEEDNKELKEEYESFAALEEACGEFDSIIEHQIDYKEDKGGNTTAVVTAVVSCKTAKLSVQAVYGSEAYEDEEGEIAYPLVDYKFEEYKQADISKAEVMKTAGINTIMSMAIVFAVLLLIAALIGCFIFISKVQNAAKPEAPAVASAVAVAAPVEEEAETDDLELAAVIMAAVAAASGEENTDGLVVRSIKRRRG